LVTIIKYEIEKNDLAVVLAYIENTLSCKVGNPLLTSLGELMKPIYEKETTVKKN